MLSKDQLIDRILTFNRSARRDWLAMFSRSDLGQYLAQLDSTRQPRNADSYRVRLASPEAIFAKRSMLWG